MADPIPYKVAASGAAGAAPAGSIPIALYGADSGAPAGVAWADVTDKPAVIAAGATQADARTAIGAVTVGTAATDAKAGNYTPPNATTAAKGLVNQAAAQADLAGSADLPATVAAYNALLAKLRAAGILAP